MARPKLKSQSQAEMPLSQHPWDQFESLKEQSYLYIDQALLLEKTDTPQRSLIMYQRGLDCLDKALDLPVELPGSTADSLKKMRKSKAKMSRTRQQVVFRIQELSPSPHIDKKNIDAKNSQHYKNVENPCDTASRMVPSAPPLSEMPPSYENSVQNAIQDALQEICDEPSDIQSNVIIHRTEEERSLVEVPSNADILFSIPSEVQLFYIRVDGNVSAPTYPAALYVYRFKDLEPSKDISPALLQVGSWVYPLVPGRSPVLRSACGSYMFPDLDESIEGNAIGLILPPTVSEMEKKKFECILNEFTATKKGEDISQYDEYMEYSEKVSQGLTKGAEMVGYGLVKASTKGGELMRAGTVKLKEKILPDSESKPVDPRVRKGLEAAQWVSDKTVRGSGWLVSKAGVATVALGRFLAPHIHNGGTKMISHFAEQSDEKSKKQVAIASELASGSVEAISTVYVALENSSKILAKNIANNTVDIVQHKYGTEVGQVTDNALSAAGNTYLTGNNKLIFHCCRSFIIQKFTKRPGPNFFKT